MATVLQNLKVILGIETKGFPGVQNQIRGLTEGVQRNLAGVKTAIGGFFTVAAGAALVRSVAQMAGRWKDIAEETGVGVEEIQKYDAFAKRASGTVEDMAAAWDMLTEKRKDALEKGGESARMFRGFGITESELRNLKTGEELFRRIAAAANDPKNQGQREQFIDLFGRKKAGKLLNIAGSVAEGGEVSVMSDAAVKQLDDAAKAFERASIDFKTAASPLVAKMAEWISVATKFHFGDDPERDAAKQREDMRQRIIKDASELLGGTFSKDDFTDVIQGNAKAALAEGLEFVLGGKGGVKKISDIEKRANKAFGIEGEATLGDTISGLRSESDENEASYKARKAKREEIGNVLKILENEDLSSQSLEALAAQVIALRKGRPAVIDRSVSTFGADIPATPGDEFTSANSGFAADQQAAREKYQSALDALLFRASNTTEKKRQLEADIKRDTEEASRLRMADGPGDVDRATALEVGILKKAGERAELERGMRHEWKADSLASVGGLIGGAASSAIDPAVMVQQDILKVLNSILTNLNGLPPNLRQAIVEATQSRPIQNIGGGR
jgi:hypothetical protein